MMSFRTRSRVYFWMYLFKILKYLVMKVGQLINIVWTISSGNILHHLDDWVLNQDFFDLPTYPHLLKNQI